MTEIDSIYQDGDTLRIRLTNGKTLFKRKSEIHCRFDPDLRGNSACYDSMADQIVFSSASHRDECVRLWNQGAQPRADQENAPRFEPLKLPEPEHPATA
jgi:hypothetical protein